MFPNVLSGEQARVLELLSREQECGRFYLAGGTGLALRFGHRQSEDFDFFSPAPFGNSVLKEKMSHLAPLTVLQDSEGTLTVEIESVRASFLNYPYPLLGPPESTPWGFAIASNEDIGAMKLSAVASRGSKRDFFDLFVLCSGPLPFGALFEAFRRKFASVRFDEYHLLRSLSYFDDAESEPDLRMIRPITWEQVKQFFRTLAAKRME
ncbi:MAG: nucleotidyl transferase AbiEii/AbiGii toxin family protein [Planctomycetota bacterium]